MDKDQGVCKACTPLIWPRGVSWRPKPIPYNKKWGTQKGFYAQKSHKALLGFILTSR